MGLCLVIANACGSRDNPKATAMNEDKKFDFLAEDIATRELYARHRGDGPDMVATLRAALRSDSRANVRQNAIVALAASPAPERLDDFILGLDDPDPAVVSEAGFSIAARLKDLSLADEAKTRAVNALQSHAAALRTAFESKRERVRFNAMMALEAFVDRELDVSTALNDEGSLIRSEGLALATARANLDQKLSARDTETLIVFVGSNTDPRLRDDAIGLLVQFAPHRVEPLLINAIADDTIGYQGLKHVVALHLTSAVPAIISYVQLHRDRWSKEYLQTLAAFHAVCAAPLMVELFVAEPDKVRRAWISDALRDLAERPGASDSDLISWAKQQHPDSAPCR